METTLCEICRNMHQWLPYPTRQVQNNSVSANHAVLENTVSGAQERRVDIRNRTKVKVAQSCPTLCDPVDYTVHGILHVRTLEWVAFPFSRGSSQPRDRTQVSHIANGFFTSWATKEYAKASMGKIEANSKINH